MTLLEKVKANLILEHSADDELLQMYITAAIRYAEVNICRNNSPKKAHAPYNTTSIFNASHPLFYESMGTAARCFFATSSGVSKCGIRHLLLRMDRDWKV
jgi:hypothetical protein